MFMQFYNFLKNPRRLALILAGLLFGSVVLVLSQIMVGHLIAKYFASDLSQQFGLIFNLNHYFVKAIFYGFVIVLVPIISFFFYLNHKSIERGLFALTAMYGALSLVLGIGIWLNPLIDQRCYTLTPSGVSYLELRPGEIETVDPRNGRKCLKVTAEILPVLVRYEKGERPSEITRTEDVEFFSSVSGEAIVWYARYANGEIVIYDLLGFDPVVGEQLLAVTKEVVAEWAEQVRARREPLRLTGELRFFGPRGEPTVWYGRSHIGEIEFFDGRGHHPVSGIELRPVTREFVERYFQEQDRIRIEKEIAALKQKAAQEAEEAERQKTLLAGENCDRLAGNPNDRHRNTSISGVPYSVLLINSGKAIEECASAMQINPDNQRYKYQFARAKQAVERESAAQIMSDLVSYGYPAAHDNLGWILLQRGKRHYSQAADIFGRGAKLGDPDSMVSLAKMHSSGALGQKNLSLTLLWLERAAELGHPEAQELFAKYEQEKRSGQVAAQLFLGLLGSVVEKATRR